jgi:hypothetical protein
MGETQRVNVSMNAGDESPEAIAAQQVADKEALAAADAGVSQINGEPVVTGDETNSGDQVAQRPDDIPEKFWDATKGEVNTAALLKAQKDGEEALRAAQNGETKKTDEGSEGDGTDADDKSADNQSNAVADANTEYAEKGELSDATYDNLAKQGLDRGMVDAYISGQEAVAGKLQDAAWGQFDGAENFTKAQEWAREKLTDEQIGALDVQITSDNPAIVAEGAKALKALYEADADITPTNQITGGNAGVTSGGHFKSTAEMQAAMSDPKYKVDAAFRQDVADKIARAGEAGVNLF